MLIVRSLVKKHSDLRDCPKVLSKLLAHILRKNVAWVDRTA